LLCESELFPVRRGILSSGWTISLFVHLGTISTDSSRIVGNLNLIQRTCCAELEKSSSFHPLRHRFFCPLTLQLFVSDPFPPCFFSTSPQLSVRAPVRLNTSAPSSESGSELK